MRKLVVAIVVFFALAGGTAAAQSPYFGAPTVSATPQTVAPGGDVTVTVQNCDIGTVVSIELAGVTVMADCSGSSAPVQGFRAPAQTPEPGTATGVVGAPTTAGTYDGTASGSSNGEPFSLSFQVTVQAPTTTSPAGDQGGVAAALPSTGGGGIEPIAVTGIVLLVVGLGLLVVTQVRRRQGVAA